METPTLLPHLNVHRSVSPNDILPGVGDIVISIFSDNVFVCPPGFVSLVNRYASLVHAGLAGRTILFVHYLILMGKRSSFDENIWTIFGKCMGLSVV